MKTLALRIYLTVVTVLLVFALVTGWLAQRNVEHERHQAQSVAVLNERVAAWGELLENSLPSVDSPQEEQAVVFLDWAERLRLPMALDNPQGTRIATSPALLERLQQWPDAKERMQKTRLSDGRVLWVMRPGLPRGHGPGFMDPRRGGGGREGGRSGRPPADPWLAPFAWLIPPWLVDGVPALVLSLFVLFVAVAVGAWPVANRLTRRLKALRKGVEVFGSGQLQHRVVVEGRDEVATLAMSFNDAAQRIEDLVTSNRSLLANASHELRSPLARLKMAISIMSEMPPDRAAQLREEIHQDIRELDALVEEVLLASRLDTRADIERQPVDLLGLATEEARRVQAEVALDGAVPPPVYVGDERLLRRALRNLLENARRYGGPDIEVSLRQSPGQLEIAISDRGPGVPPDQCERIFEPFYRLPGHAEHAGGVGLGLSLVRQIAQRHGGGVRCESRDGGGSRFVIVLPVKPG